ncbi:MAG: polyphosphate polymerase domain-containing protein [Muribaculaceae bacterium]|nr:polyphosphate polymerase domain-containing protein [Muribaculaceae bacterium]
MVDNKIIEAFETISLEEMGKVRLMNRVDSKYLTTVERIEALLRAASTEFYIQQIDGRSIMPYYTRYYDTPDADMYYQHQRGKKGRQKIRVRLYEETDADPFVEIKTKSNKGRTRKKRVAMTDHDDDLHHYHEFLSDNSDYDPSSLIPKIENHFYRITLVNKDMTERITIDTDLEFHNLSTDRRVCLPGVGIIEWKRDGHSDRSSLASILRDLRLHPGGFSKYCIGMAVTNPELRQNRLKKRLRLLAKTIASSPLSQEPYTLPTTK